MRDLKQEWLEDLKEKIKFVESHPPKIEYFLFPEERNDDEAIKRAESYMEKRRKENTQKVKYFVSMIEKVKQLKKNPSTKEEILQWYYVLDELSIDFTFRHDSPNMEMGRAGTQLLESMFDIKNNNKNDKNI